jgi:hypothetical protein
MAGPFPLQKENEMTRSRFIVLILGVMSCSFADCALAAQPKCFSTEIVPAVLTSPTEKTFTFSDVMHLCDGDGYESAVINGAVVLIVGERRDVMKAETPELKSVTYYELNYGYYNGSGTWGGRQWMYLTVQDQNHKDLFPTPIYADDTPRGSCRYGHPVPVRAANPLSIFDTIAFVTMAIERVGGLNQGRC